MRKAILIVIAALLAVILTVHAGRVLAAPAAPIEYELEQPGGFRFQARTRGDEYVSWTETADGFTILRRNSTWYYAEPDPSGGIRNSGVEVGQLSQAQRNAWPRGLRPEMPAGLFETRNPRRALPVSSGLDGPLGVTRTQRVLVIRVDYDDVDFEHSDATIESLIFGANDSVREYFLENSYGDFDLVPAAESYGTANDGIVQVVRGINHPDAGQDFGQNNAEAAAIMPLTDGFVNYASFDDNGDGDITPDELSIVMILAGYERSYGGDADAKTPSVWGHQSSFASFFPPLGLLTLDGKNLAPYTMFGEQHGSQTPALQDHLATIGIVCHELGHLMFDLPDLYDSDQSSAGIGNWGLMGGGSWNSVGTYSGETPAHFNAWSKTVVGFLDPSDQLTSQTGVTFNSMHATADARRLWVDPYGWNEYFLVENRQLSDYDAGLPGSGLQVWHIDETRTNNRTESRKWVDLEEADGLGQLDADTNRGDAGDVYPGTSSNTAFNDGSNPNSKDYANSATQIAVSNISASGQPMTADLTPRTGFSGDHVSYSERRPRLSSGFGSTTGYAGVRVQNSTSLDELHGVDVYITDPASATVDISFYTSLAGGTPSGLIHSETGFAAGPGWNRLLLASPQSFPAAAERGIVVKIVNASNTAPFSLDNSRLGSGRSYRDADGSGTFGQVCVGPGYTCGDLNVVTLLGTSADTDPPSVTSIIPSTTGPTNADSVSFDVSFDEDVVNFNNASDVIVNHTGTAHTGLSVNGSADTYTVQVTGISGDGSFSIELNTASDIEDTSGNGLESSPSSAAVNIDNTAPGISIGSPSAALTSSGPVEFAVTYTAADSVSLANEDVALITSGDANGTVNVTGSGTASRTVTISSITGDGTLGISIASGTASDTAGNQAAGAGPSATFTVDNTPPGISISQPSVSNTVSGPVTYTINYTGADAVTLQTGDISLNSTGTATGTVGVSGSGTASRTVTISAITGDGTLGISIASSTASDTAGNQAAGAGPSATFSVGEEMPDLIFEDSFE